MGRKTTPGHNKVINLKEAARILGVDKATVSRHRKKLGVGTWLGAAYALTGDDVKKLRKSIGDTKR